MSKALALIPPDAPAAIIIPSLKLCSDELERCLEGMDRAELLMGSRPLDQLKSTLGVSVAIDDMGSAALVSRPIAGEQSSLVMLVPVLDADQFLKANFRRGEAPDAYVNQAGLPVFARSLDSHVLLGQDAEAIAHYQPGPGAVDRVRGTMGDRGWSAASQGEIVLLIDPRQVRRPARLPGGPWMDAADGAIMSIDLDPLGVIVRGVVHVNAQGAPASAPSRSKTGGKGLARVPAKAGSFYLAASIDIAGLGGPEAARNLAPMGPIAWPQWLFTADRVQFAAYPSPAGAMGGLLNDAVLVMETRGPRELKAAMRQWMLALSAPGAGGGSSVQWTEDAPIKGDGHADAYEFRSMPMLGPDAAASAIGQSLMFGNAGWRGYVRATDDAVLLTFSQRPAVFRDALAVIEPVAGQAGGSLASDPVIRMIHQWLPPRADVEVYLGMGPLMTLAGQMAAAYGASVPLPPDPGLLDPVGVGVDVDGELIEWAGVIPASVLNAVLGMGMERFVRPQGPPPDPGAERPGGAAPSVEQGRDPDP